MNRRLSIKLISSKSLFLSPLHHRKLVYDVQSFQPHFVFLPDLQSWYLKHYAEDSEISSLQRAPPLHSQVIFEFLQFLRVIVSVVQERVVDANAAQRDQNPSLHDLAVVILFEEVIPTEFHTYTLTGLVVIFRTSRERITLLY